jgi:Nif-specific ferredoxin III
MGGPTSRRGFRVSTFRVKLPSGVEWVPSFVQSIDTDKCVGCGRCFKVCLRGVLQLRGLDEDGELVDEDDDEDEYERKVMTVAEPENCIGCQACAMVCAKKCFSHAPLDLVA